MFNTQVATVVETRTNRIITGLAEMRDAARARMEKIDNTQPKRLDTMTVGDVARQGDVYIVALSRVPETTGAYTSRQVVPGTTQGSQHVVTSTSTELAVPVDRALFEAIREVVPTFNGTVDGANICFAGPVMITHGQDVVLAHPEHAERTFPGDVPCYAVIYQRTCNQVNDAIQRQLD